MLVETVTTCLLVSALVQWQAQQRSYSALFAPWHSRHQPPSRAHSHGRGLTQRQQNQEELQEQQQRRQQQQQGRRRRGTLGDVAAVGTVGYEDRLPSAMNTATSEATAAGAAAAAAVAAVGAFGAATPAAHSLPRLPCPELSPLFPTPTLFTREPAPTSHPLLLAVLRPRVVATAVGMGV